MGLGLNYQPNARFKRKVLFEDITKGRVDAAAVQVLDHDGTLRTARPAELLHRFNIKKSRKGRAAAAAAAASDASGASGAGDHS